MESSVREDLRAGIIKARQASTKKALEKADKLNFDQFVKVLKDDYLQGFSGEISQSMRSFMDHVRRFQKPSPEERSMYVSEEIEARYFRYPRYVKALITQNPELVYDPTLQESMRRFESRLNPVPDFRDELIGDAQAAWDRDMAMNPEILFQLYEKWLAKHQSQYPTALGESGAAALSLEKGHQTSGRSNGSSDTRRAPALPPGMREPSGVAPSPAQSNARLDEIRVILKRLLAELKEKRENAKELAEALELARQDQDTRTIEILDFSYHGLKREIAGMETDIERLQTEGKRLKGGSPTGGSAAYGFALPVLLMATHIEAWNHFAILLTGIAIVGVTVHSFKQSTSRYLQTSA